MRTVITVSTIACGLIAAALSLAGESAAACDSADCVPNVARNVVAGAPCAPRPSFVFGLDGDDGTLICTPQGTWVAVGRLVGEREVTMPCFTPGDTAQQPLAGNDLQLMRTPGVPLKCAQINSALRWVNFF
ncbi:hypothetical protein Mycsm_04451 [Mycobacterium sp. JS623]|uniref:hypothetical protein n=1 Tax=Mycobacterium sp. JS623 TaxID=212767 RepID=UPI0002A54C79|nr:hypothetical protein [Mycobacterium sp. JS623]AGB24689.1 hypothetical protein Mycsm_04451 [Mycobacterium sp. JS623]